MSLTAGFGARPVGAAVGALVGAAYGAEASIIAAAAGFGIPAVVILASPVLRLSRQP